MNQIKQWVMYFGRFLLWVARANPYVIYRREFADDRSLYMCIGLAIVLTSLFAGIGMAFMLAESFSRLMSIIIGIVWGIAVANLDRILVPSLNKGRADTAKSVWLRALPRLLLGALVASSVAEPFLLKVYAPDVAVQMEVDRQVESKAARARSYHAKEIKRLRDREADVRRHLLQVDSMLRDAHRDAIGEAEGRLGSGLRGKGNLFDQKYTRFQSLQREKDTLQREIGVVRARQDSLHRLVNEEIKPLENRLDAREGFLNKHKALNRLMQDPETGWAMFFKIWSTRMLIFLLEISPFLLKLGSQRTAYSAEMERRRREQIGQSDRRSDVADSLFNIEDALQKVVESRATEILDRLKKDPDAFIEEENALRKRAKDMLAGIVGGKVVPAPLDADVPDTDGVDPETVPQAATQPPGRDGAHRRGMRALWNGCRAVWRFKPTRIGLFIVGGIMLGAVAIGSAAAWYTREAWLTPCGGPCPYEEKIHTVRTPTQILDTQGNLLGSIPSFPYVKLEEIPPYFEHLTLAAEDKRYRSHIGVDPLAIMNAGMGCIIGRCRGASTITQQLARTLFTERLPKNRWLRKIAEARVALDLEKILSKDDILELYLNTVDLGWMSGRGRNIRGIVHAAAWRYGKDFTQINLDESATLVASIKGPTFYNPTEKPERTRIRRNWVLGRLLALYPQYGAAAAVDFNIPSPTIPPERVSGGNTITSLVRERFTSTALPQEVKTTIDPALQRAIEGERQALLKDVESGRYGLYNINTATRLAAGIIVLENKTGKVLAVSCGGAEVQWEICAKGTFLMNSTIKPLLFAQGIESGVLRVDDDLGDVLRRVPRPLSPYLKAICEKSRDRHGWSLTRLASVSDNCIAVSIHAALPVDAFQPLIRLGVPLDPAKPATSLGSGSMPLLRLGSLMAGFANGGSVPMWRILQEDSVMPDSERLPFRASTISAVRNIFGGVLAGGGTGALAGSYLPTEAREVFAKTGTGRKREDFLMVGADQQHTVVLWLGHVPYSRTIVEATAGPVLGESWGRVLSAASEIHGVDDPSRRPAPQAVPHHNQSGGEWNMAAWEPAHNH